MEKIFYADISAFTSSEAAVQYILKTHFDTQTARIARTENGKPYLENSDIRLFFSVSHTKTALFVAFSDENVGLDAEALTRQLDYKSVLKRFPIDERSEITSVQDFLKHWTVKESAIKWLGGTIAQDLAKLSYINGELRYNGLDIPIYVTTLTYEGHCLSVCSERNFSSATFIKL